MNGSNGSEQTEDLQVISLRDMQVEIAPTAHQAKELALGAAGLVSAVDNEDQNAFAFEAQKAILALLRSTEKCRKEIKQPVIDVGREIDQKARVFVNDLQNENLRISRLIGDYQALKLAKERAAEQLKTQELSENERRLKEEIAASKSLDEVDSARERHAQVAAMLSAPLVHITQNPKGQTVREDWDVRVTDSYLLARAHPGLVNITPRLVEIKAALNAGQTIAGIEAVKVVKAGAR